MSKVSKPIPETIFDVLEYSENSPSGLIWKTNIGRSRKKEGDPAGYLDTKDRWCVKYNRQLYKAHRVVWYLHHKELNPEMEVDHIDGNSKNNLIGNLRVSTCSQNNQNKKVLLGKGTKLPKGINYSMSPGATSGYMVARIYLNGQSFSKSSHCLETLVSWPKDEREKLHGEFANNG